MIGKGLCDSGKRSFALRNRGRRGTHQDQLVIDSTSGEIAFAGRLSIVPHVEIKVIAAATQKQTTDLPIEGWHQHWLGIHRSEFGDFETEVVTGPETRVEAVFLTHQHSFYEAGTPEDGERRTFHEGLIA